MKFQGRGNYINFMIIIQKKLICFIKNLEADGLDKNTEKQKVHRKMSLLTPDYFFTNCCPIN